MHVDVLSVGHVSLTDFCCERLAQGLLKEDDLVYIPTYSSSGRVGFGSQDCQPLAIHHQSGSLQCIGRNINPCRYLINDNKSASVE